MIERCIHGPADQGFKPIVQAVAIGVAAFGGYDITLRIIENESGGINISAWCETSRKGRVAPDISMLINKVCGNWNRSYLHLIRAVGRAQEIFHIGGQAVAVQILNEVETDLRT